MAFSILIEVSLEHHNWDELNDVLTANSYGFIEFFPITHFSNVGKNYIGMSILRRSDYSDVIQHIEAIIMRLISLDCGVFELYSSSEFTASNCTALVSRFFS